MYAQFFMNIITSIQNIFNISYYDLKNNFKNWCYLLIAQALIVQVLFLHHYLPGTFTITFPDLIFGLGSFQLNLGEEYFSLASNLTSFLMCLKVVLAIMYKCISCILFPIMILQNALDLAFDSNMRGFTLKGPVISYIVAVTGYFILRDFIMNHCGFFLTYLSAFSGIYFIIFITTIFIIHIYIFETFRFVGLHIFEYQQGILKSIQASYEMTRNKILFLSIISTLQVLIMLVIILTSLYIVDFINAWIHIPKIIPFDILVKIASPFLIVWYYLIEAHLYRTLVCPPNEKSGCESCECGS